MLEYRPDQIKIVDFLLLAKFWACLLFFPHPLHTYVLSAQKQSIKRVSKKKCGQAQNIANSKKSTILIDLVDILATNKTYS